MKVLSSIVKASSTRHALSLMALAFFCEAGFAQQGTDQLHEQVLSSSLWKTFSQKLTENYVTPIDTIALEARCKKVLRPQEATPDDQRSESCIRAAIEGLDLAGTYISPSERKAQIEESRRNFVGIGLELRPYRGGNGYVEIVSPIRGAAADRAGLRAGDLIYSIDGVETKGMTLMESIKVMRGEVGTYMTVMLHRPGAAEPLRFVVRREAIVILSTRAKLLSPGLGYLRISRFRDRTRSEVIADIAKLEAANGGPLQKLVLDLRHCPGGLLSSTVGIAALFVAPGSDVLRVRGARAGTNHTYGASPEDFGKSALEQAPEPAHHSLKSARLLVLANGSTGAGAEALTAILREKRNAVVMGQTTFGMATVESVLSLDSGAAMQIATGLMSTPRGHSWQGAGVEPDVALDANAGAQAEFGDLPSDAQLASALSKFE